MPQTSDPRVRRRSCNAVSLLARTVRTLRQHDCVPRLGEHAIARCREGLGDALSEGELAIELGDGEVRCEGQTVLLYGPADVPFGLLAKAGVGKLILARCTSPEHIERLVRLLAAPAERDRDLATELGAARIPGLQLRAPSATRRGTFDEAADWWLLPEPVRAPEFARYVERECEASPASRAMRLLLTDLGNGTCDQPIEAVLVRLLEAMLGGGDAAGAAFLLEQADHRPEIPAAIALHLRRAALEAYEGAWLWAELEHEHQVQGLVSLGLQLGDENLERLVATARASGIALPPWVSSMLPPKA